MLFVFIHLFVVTRVFFCSYLNVVWPNSWCISCCCLWCRVVHGMACVVVCDTVCGGPYGIAWVWFIASTTIVFLLVFAYGTLHDIFPLLWCWYLPPSSFVQVVGGGGAQRFCCGLQIDNLAFPKGVDYNINIIYFALCIVWRMNDYKLIQFLAFTLPYILVKVHNMLVVILDSKTWKLFETSSGM